MCHCLPKRWHHMSVHLNAAGLIPWLANLCGIDDALTLLDKTAQANTQTDCLFLPYLSGERTPHNDPYARGVFFGLSPTTTHEQLCQATLEGVALALAQGQDAIAAAQVDINQVYVVGGGANNKYWGKIIASALNQSLIYTDQAAIGAALGAAYLAWLGYHEKTTTADLPRPKVLYTIDPDATITSELSRKNLIFKKLYQQLKPVFQQAYATQE